MEIQKKTDITVIIPVLNEAKNFIIFNFIARTCNKVKNYKIMSFRIRMQ